MRDIRDRKTAEARASYFNQLLTSILQISQAIIHTDNPGELFQKCCEILYENRKYMDVRMFLMLDSGKPRLICHHGSGHECEEDHGSEEDVSISSPPCIIEVIEKGSIKLIENTSEHCSDCGCCRVFSPLSASTYSCRLGYSAYNVWWSLALETSGKAPLSAVREKSVSPSSSIEPISCWRNWASRAALRKCMISRGAGCFVPSVVRARIHSNVRDLFGPTST